MAYAWSTSNGIYHVIVVNYAEHRGQCYLVLPFPDLHGKRLRLTDLMGDEVYDRDGGDLIDRGLYIDQAAWQINVFEVKTIDG